jgi:hypothetical protein
MQTFVGAGSPSDVTRASGANSIVDRFADQNRRKRDGRKPETFDFLGFTHICARKHWSGGFIVKRLSSAKRLRSGARQ